MRVWKLFKCFIKGVMVALMVSSPLISNRVYAVNPVIYNMNVNGPDIVMDTGTPFFLCDGTWNPNFTMTWYDVVQEKGVQVSHGEYWNDNKMRVYNNDIQYYDEEYGWLQVVAVNIDQVKQFGYGRSSVVNSNMLGSVIEINYPDGTKEKAIILDACGKARTERIVDRWVYNGKLSQSKYGRLEGIEFKFVRFGF